MAARYAFSVPNMTRALMEKEAPVNKEDRELPRFENREFPASYPYLSEAEKDRLTREALADVDAGRTISHEEMERRYDEILFPWLEQRAKVED